MSRLFPALEISWAIAEDAVALERLLLEVDDVGPIALQERDLGAVIFFAAASDRDRAIAVLAERCPAYRTSPIDVPDDDWAARSQAMLQPIVVGRFLIAPPWALTTPGEMHERIVIQPSRGFGTGHHSTTRLCLELLQRSPLTGARVLDVGTGSGVLAIAAHRLGASRVFAIDNDSDALESARENLELNAVVDTVALRHLDIEEADALEAPFDVITANLTGALIGRIIASLGRLSAPNGRLIVSGVLAEEAPVLLAKFQSAGLTVSRQLQRDEWMAFDVTIPTRSTVR
jgi:ribosomal protein L11 methyltransferase